MKTPSLFAESQEVDTVFGTRELTDEDVAAMQEFIAKTKNSPENRAAVAAMQQRGKKVVVVDKKSTKRKPAQRAA